MQLLEFGISLGPGGKLENISCVHLKEPINQSLQNEKKKGGGIPNIFYSLMISFSYHIHFWVVGNTILADLTLSWSRACDLQMSKLPPPAG